MRSAPLTSPVRISILKISCPMYCHAIVTAGRVAAVETEPPVPDMIVAMIPPHTLKIAVIISIQLPTATFARMKRIKCRRANSGRWKSRKLAALWKMPIAKDRTNRP